MLLGLPGDNTYANYSEANRALWRLTIVPLAERIVKGLGRALEAWWPGFKAQIDLDALPALAGDRAALWAQVSAAGPRHPAIADPVGGATVDWEARAGVAAILAALRAHGLIG